MSLVELLITLGDLRRRSGIAVVNFGHYAKRNVFGFTFASIQILFIFGYSFAAEHKNWDDRSNDVGIEKETSPEESIPMQLNPSNGLQALFLSLLGQGLMYSYLRKYGYSAIGFSFLVGIMILEWGVLLRYFFESMLCQNVRLSYLQGCPYRDSVSLPHFVNQMSSKACTCSNFKEPLRLEPIEIMKSNMDSLSTIITFGALLGKVSPVQLTTLGLFQSMLYHANRFAIDLTLGAVDDMGGATVTHVFGAVYGTATSIMIYKTHPGFDHPEHNSRYVSGLYAFWGTMWVWVALPAYNGFLTPDELRQRVVLNTFLGLMGSSGISYICSFIILPLETIVVGAISGGIALGNPFSPFLTPAWALLVGCLTGFVVALWIKMVQPRIAKFDTMGITALHLVPGLLGSLFFSFILVQVTIIGCILSIDTTTIPIAESTSELLQVFPLADQKWESTRIQLLQLVVAILVSSAGGIVTGYIVKFMESHNTLNYFSDSAFWHVPLDFKKMEEERGVEII